MGWRLVKYLLIYFLYYSKIILLYSFIRRHLRKNEITVLAYHRVLELDKVRYNYSPTGMVVSTSTFQKQLDYLCNNYNIISLEMLQKIIENKTELPPNSCMITFDDGWKDNYINSFPILKKKNIPATIFLTTNYVNGTDVFWYTKLLFIIENGDWENIDFRKIEAYNFPKEFEKEIKILKKLSRKKRTYSAFNNCVEIVKYYENITQQKIINDLSELLDVKADKLENKDFFLTWDEVRKMAEHNISFGSHTVSHKILTTINDFCEIRKELIDSKNEIGKHINKPVISFAYPNGDWNLNIIKLLKQAGYHVAFTLSNGLNALNINNYLLRRINIHESVSKGIISDFSNIMFAFELSGIKVFLNKLRFLK